MLPEDDHDTKALKASMLIEEFLKDCPLASYLKSRDIQFVHTHWNLELGYESNTVFVSFERLQSNEKSDLTQQTNEIESILQDYNPRKVHYKGEDGWIFTLPPRDTKNLHPAETGFVLKMKSIVGDENFTVTEGKPANEN